MSTEPTQKKSELQPGDDAASASQEGAGDAKDASKLEAMYDRFTDRVRELSETSQEKGREAMERALESAREQLSAAGEFSAEQGQAFKEFMRQDLEQTQRDMKSASNEARDYLHPARLGAGALSSIARMLEAGGEALQNLSRKAEDVLHFHTGDLTTAGTLTCTKCEQKVQLKTTTKIPPCPSCQATNFRKGY